MVVFYTYILFSKKSSLSDPKTSLESRFDWFRFLFEPFKPEYYFCTSVPPSVDRPRHHSTAALDQP